MKFTSPKFRGLKRKQIQTLAFSAVISLLFLTIVHFFFISKPDQQTETAQAAIRRMHQVLKVISAHCRAEGIKPETENDPNLTFLIGPELSPLTTTLGHLDAKRTTTNPQIAGLIVRLLLEAGVSKGDRVAIGSSGSFPALMLASVCAVQAMQAEPIVILSIGSSAFGATRPEFNLVSIYDLLQAKGLFKYQAAGFSLGGQKDSGLEFPENLRSRLIAELRSRKQPFIFEPDLRKNVALRMALYKPDSLAAFINCGGSTANMGLSSKILNVKPGLVQKTDLPPVRTRGVIFEMASLKIPVIHLLFIKGLTQKYGLVWDPVPLPGPDQTGQGRINPDLKFLFGILLAVYLGITGILIRQGNKTE